MTIRETIDGLLASKTEQESFQNDRSAYLDDQGLGDVPTDLIDTAFVHYADTAPIEQADVLAPLVTRVGPVPYEETDLPDGITDELGEGAPPDPWSMLTFDETTPAIDPETEIDPADLDDTESPIEDTPGTDTQDGADFGAGETSIADGFDSDDLGDDPFYDETTGQAGSPSLDDTIEHAVEEATTDYASDVEAFADSANDGYDDDIDPMDLDFDE